MVTAVIALMTSILWFPYWAQLSLSKLYCVFNWGRCKVEILPFLFYLVHVVSSCATVNSPRGQQQHWMAEEDPAEGAAAHCFLQEVQLAGSSRHLFFIYLFILLQYDSETTRIWLADSFFRRFVVTQMFSFLSGASGPSASSWVPPFISPSLEVASY